MSTYTRSSMDVPECEPSAEEMQQMMTDKAHELFTVCDTEEKGFITKRDMQRLQNELPLSPDQLEHVFDSLDDDGNGFLTLEEFTDGFGSFLGIKSSTAESGEMETNETYADDHIDPAEEAHNFRLTMDSLGATNVFADESTVQSLWSRLRRDDADVASHFEDLLYRVANELKKSRLDFDTLEGALRKFMLRRVYVTKVTFFINKHNIWLDFDGKTSAHDEEVRKLYEEMEVQIKQEKEKILSEERTKERQLRDAMENELLEKDHQLQEFLTKHTEMEERLGFLNTIETETKIENEKLAKEKDELEDMLMKSQISLEESQSYINQVRQTQKEENRERAKAAIKLSEGIAVERETLVKQLGMLKNMNRQLQDEKDEADIRRDISSDNTSLEAEMDEPGSRNDTPRRSEQDRRGSTLGKYFNPKRIPKLSSYAESFTEDVELQECGRIPDIDDGIECDDDMYIDGQTPAFMHHSVNSFHHDGRAIQISPWQQRAGHEADEAVVDLDLDDGSGSSSYSPDSSRVQPVGADELTDSGIQNGTESRPIQRVFKVVFVGDSGVGKSSFIHRFCSNHFKAFAATIGVDFQVKNLPIEDQIIVLQLWDTAGQERFRSITKQYFRKADGVVIMYDVTSEMSFTNVRNWMTSVQEGVSEDAVLVLLGNKNDLPEDDETKPVKMKTGSRLADEYGTLFYETSALSGENVDNCMEALARVLKETEDKLIENSFHLEETSKKKGCCS